MNARQKAKKYKMVLDRLNEMYLSDCRLIRFSSVSNHSIKTYKSRRIIDRIDRPYVTPHDVEWLKKSMVKDLAENLVNDGCVKFNQVNRDTGAIELECTLMAVKIEES